MQKYRFISNKKQSVAALLIFVLNVQVSDTTSDSMKYYSLQQNKKPPQKCDGFIM